MTPADDTPLALELLRSLGPFVAAAVALYIAFRSERRQRRERPELRLIYEHKTSDDFAAGVGDPSMQTHWVRLRVANRWGKRTAEDVEMLVIDLRPRRAEGSLNGFALKWSNMLDAHGQPITRQTIPSGIARHVDLVCTLGPTWDFDQPKLVEGETWSGLQLQVHPVPSGTRRIFDAGAWTLLLALTAKDTDAAYYAVNVDFDGKRWSADHIREHLKVSVNPAHYFALEPDEAARRATTRVDRLAS